MKYELNTPYDLKVKNVTEKEGILVFEVEIGDYLFPVQAYPEQLEGETPSIISCRIVQDKNKDAYLVQNEAFFYPAIYKPHRKYIFEVVDIKDNYVIVQDKHGLFHAMDKDGSKISVNELIVRCVEIVKDNNYKAHLIFHIPEPIEKKEEVETAEPKTVVQVQPQAVSTIFEQDSPGTISVSNEKETENNVINLPEKEEKKHNNDSVCSMLLSENWDGLLDYLDDNLKGSQIRPIQREIATAIEKCQSSELYWDMVQFLLNYDAHMFLSTLAKSDTSHISDLPEINSDVLNGIVSDAFSDPDKTKYAIEILKPCGKRLSTGQKNYIQEKCANLNTCEAFYDLFKLLSLSPNDAIYYLLSLQNNNVAAYTLYKFYIDGKKNNCINEKSLIESFRPSKIIDYVNIMEKSHSFAFIAAASLINYNILSRDSCSRNLQNRVSKDGLDGFQKYISNQIQQSRTNNFLSSLSRGDTLTELNYVKELDNYYLLIEKQTGVSVLLDKKFVVKKPALGEKCQADIVRKISNNGKIVFIVAQKPIPSMYTFPPLANNSTILEVAFSEHNGIWYPEVKNYTKLLNIEVEIRPRFLNFKLKHKAAIIRKKDFFTYCVRILDSSN